MEDLYRDLLAFIEANQSFALPVGFATSMAESIIGISLFVPSTLILFGIAAALGVGGGDVVGLWLASAFGASLGDWVSYSLGYFFEPALQRSWPLRGNEALVLRGRTFFERWGWVSFFPSRFIGPLRSFMPLVAGLCEMPPLPFALASLASAMVWAGVILAPAGLAAQLLSAF